MGGGEPTAAIACRWGAGPGWAVCRARDRDEDRRMPQERAIDGPAVYPMNAPATAPIGPNTTAPDTAPSAALPARS